MSDEGTGGKERHASSEVVVPALARANLSSAAGSPPAASPHSAGVTPPSAASPHSAGVTPPSAAGPLEPYGARFLLSPLPQGGAAEELVKELLERAAAECIVRGGTVIGHLKCLLRVGSQTVRANLTSLRRGADCFAEEVSTDRPLDGTDGGQATLHLAVLVYGISARTIEAVVEGVLSELLGPAGGRWERQTLPSEKSG